MTPQEIFDRIQALPMMVNIKGSRNPETIKELDTIHKAVFGTGFTPGCKKCVVKAYHEVSDLTLEKLIAMSNAKFKLKKDVVIQFPAFSPNHFSNANLSDKDAVKMLKTNPGLLQHFESYPKDDQGNVVLDEKQADAGKPSGTQLDKPLAKDVIAKIGTAKTLDELDNLVAGDDRATVIAAAQKRLVEINAANTEPAEQDAENEGSGTEGNERNQGEGTGAGGTE
ncbi:hypothetical protein B0I27_107113 [Arcticibacter pallidicorallinus]|uniref:Uncharacterized protein n=1 Tax=Arcticibacter pallidicorallinus TaxID=1259464 RepID=A0A2T0U0S7_9SPHI|nr:hypothetical protein [Arcticibacter pallidicorallinus]PRY51527.1 hypothetical protein B0I27_107113 [Arcticibacter pallidicorallinus]